MIKIRRTGCPAVLQKKRKAKSAYRHKTVVFALWRMQHEKCCYCEQYIPEKGHQKAVEHFRPKSVFQGRKNDWYNLLLACPQCNGKKSDDFPTELTDKPDETKVVYVRSTPMSILLDPTDAKVNPEEHIDFSVDTDESDCGLAIPRNDSRRGRETIRIVGLYDEFLTKKRCHYVVFRLLELYSVLMRAELLRATNTVKSKKNEFEMLMSKRAEFAGVTRAFVRFHKLDKRFDVNMPGE